MVLNDIQAQWMRFIRYVEDVREQTGVDSRAIITQFDVAHVLVLKSSYVDYTEECTLSIKEMCIVVSFR